MFKLSVKEMTTIALGIALIAVCSWISIPTAISFTLQTFAVCLVTALLGLKCGVWTICGYILLGAIGVPVFSGFRGGLGALLGTTGGYIVGFLFTALAVGFGVKKLGRGWVPLCASMVIGILLCYAFGTAWFMVVYTRAKGAISLGAALSMCVIPFLIPDAVKIALAAFLTRRIYPLIHLE